MLLLPIATNADDSGSCGENLTYNYVAATKTLTISGFGAMNDYSFNSSGKCDSPWWTGGYYKSIKNVVIEYGVTSIGENAFWYCQNLTSVTIPSSVASIGQGAFSSCQNLTSVIIPSSVTSIGRSAFSSCTRLSTVLIPNSVTSIADYAFQGCECLTSITIPKDVTSIGICAFANCKSLTSVTIPNSVTTIEGSTFSGCSGLSSVIIGKKVSLIRSGAFNCDGLTDVYCFAVRVPSVTVNSSPFKNIKNATLHVPAAAIYVYANDDYWYQFKEIVGDLDLPKCAKPTISLKNGKLNFECETEGVVFMPQVTPLNESSYTNGEMQLPNKYRITVYAAKEGYEYSDVATMDIEIPVGTMGDVNQDGEVNVADHVKLSDIILNK